MTSKPDKVTASKAPQSNVRPTRSSTITLTPPLTLNPKKRKAVQTLSHIASTAPPSSSNKRHATRTAHESSITSANRSGPSRMVASEEEEESEESEVAGEDEGSEYEQEGERNHGPNTSKPIGNSNPHDSGSVPSNDEIHARLDHEDQFEIPNGESAMNTQNDSEDDSDDHSSEINDEPPELTEITLYFRRGEKPVEDPITGKVRSPRKLQDWPSCKFIYHRGTGFPVFIGHINVAIDKLKEVKKPRYALLQWSVDSAPYIKPSHSAKQLKYPLLTPDDFERKIARAYYNEKSRLEGSSDPVTVNVFIYLKDTNPNEGKSVVRPSQSGIEEANRRINEARQQGGANPGPIEQTIYARDIASSTTLDPNQPIPPPPDNPLYNQARRLDRQIAERREARGAAAQESDNIATIMVLQAHDVWVPYSMDITDLRRVLGYDLTRIAERTRDPDPPPVIPPTLDFEDTEH
jgi:hypothetical protein